MLEPPDGVYTSEYWITGVMVVLSIVGGWREGEGGRRRGGGKRRGRRLFHISYYYIIIIIS